MNLPQPHPIKAQSPPLSGKVQGSLLLVFPPLCCIMSPNKTLPELLVWSFISFYWLKNLRTWVDNKPLSLRISLIVSIKKTTSLLFFFFLNWRNFKCGTRLTKDLHLSFFFFFGGGRNQEEIWSYQLNTLLTYRTPGATRHFSSSELHDYCPQLKLSFPEPAESRDAPTTLETLRLGKTYKVTTFGSSAVKRLTFFV